MPEILHRIGAKNSSPEQAYEALTTLDGLAGWWTEKTAGSTEVGGVIELRFEVGGFDMKVIQLDPAKRVRWEVVAGPPEWIGTNVQWDIHQNGEFTIVLFRHEGWREATEFMNHCTTKWGTFAVSLKQLLETGVGAPDPRDVRISDWH